MSEPRIRISWASRGAMFDKPDSTRTYVRIPHPQLSTGIWFQDIFKLANPVKCRSIWVNNILVWDIFAGWYIDTSEYLEARHAFDFERIKWKFSLSQKINTTIQK